MPDYIEQHKQRLSYMPWLFYRLKAKHLEWATPWQASIQAALQELETVTLGHNVFIAPGAHIFAEPGREVVIGDHSYVAADAVIHGPVHIGERVSINHHVSIDGGRTGVRIGDDCRLAAYAHLYAFNHTLAAERSIREQPVTSRGIVLGRDVWLGSHCGVTDGVIMGDGSVAGMSSVVTREVAPMTIVAGNPARPIGQR